MAMTQIWSNRGIKENPLFYLLLCFVIIAYFLLWLIRPWYMAMAQTLANRVNKEKPLFYLFVSFCLDCIFPTVVDAPMVSAYRLMAMAQTLSNRGNKENPLFYLLLCFVILAYFLLWLIRPWYCLPPHGYGTNLG